MSFEDFLEDYGEAISITVGVILFIGIIGFACYCSWEEEDTAETIIMSGGDQSYACTVSRVDQTPHDCKPVKEEK